MEVSPRPLVRKMCTWSATAVAHHATPRDLLANYPAPGLREISHMCGIVGAVAGRDVVPVLMEGLRRLEYRGYDSAGLAVLNGTKHLTRLRTLGKVKALQDALDQAP